MSSNTASRQAARLAPLFAVLTVACSGDPSGPRHGEALGTFTATLSGAANASINGTATFVAHEGQGYEVEMLPRGSTNGSGLWVTAGTGRPALGDYAVTPITSPQSLPTALMRYCADTSAPCFTDWGVHWETSAEAGRLQITQSTATTLAGSIEVDLRTDTGHVSGTGPRTHLLARFTARCRLTSGC